jgi:hypothetical protein
MKKKWIWLLNLLLLAGGCKQTDEPETATVLETHFKNMADTGYCSGGGTEGKTEPVVMGGFKKISVGFDLSTSSIASMTSAAVTCVVSDRTVLKDSIFSKLSSHSAIFDPSTLTNTSSSFSFKVDWRGYSPTWKFYNLKITGYK